MRGSNEQQPGEQPIKETGNSGEQIMAIDRGSKNGETGEQSPHKRGSRSKKTSDYALAGDVLVDTPASQWLKTLLPEAFGGWWDIYPKDNGFAVKFR